jgi:hypothetical protein
MSAPRVWLGFEDTLEGAREAEATIRRLREAHEGTRERDEQPSQTAFSGPNSAVTLYEHMDPSNRSRRFLTLLTEEGQTLADIASQMADPGEEAPSTGSMRAVHRNVRRTEGRLQRERRLARQVVQVSYAAYAAENAARYSLLPEDATALRAYLAARSTG